MKLKHLLLLCLCIILLNTAFSQDALKKANNYLTALKGNNSKHFAYGKGNYSVGDNGSFSYEVPILTVPGTAGMMPKISLVYNSNSGTGVMGEGWSVTGLSIITRSFKTLAQDNENGTITFTNEDRLSLDGQRLVKVDDNDPSYWSTSQNPTVHYRTELNTFKDIAAEFDPDLGIKDFIVKTKDGLVYYYGYLQTGNGVDKSGYLKTETGKVISWLLLRIMDRNGNFIQFDYNESDLQKQFIRPEKIGYTGFVNTANESRPYAYVKFNYDNGNYNNKIKNNPISKYINGQRISFDKYLSSVECYYDGDGANPLKNHIRTYKMHYVDGLNDERKLYLDYIDECIMPLDASSKCLRTKFNWKKENTTSNFSLYAVDNSGQTLEEDYQLYFGDFDGNGSIDRCAFKNDNGNLKFIFGLNKNGAFTIEKIYNLSLQIPKKSRIIATDVDANGTTDFVFNWIENDKWVIQPILTFINRNGKDSISIEDRKTVNIQSGTGLNDVFILNTDLSGDGLTDMVLYYYKDKNIVIHFALNNLANRFSSQKFQKIDRTLPNGDVIPEKTSITYGDFNSDGRNDFLFTWTDDKGWHTAALLVDSSGAFNINPSLSRNQPVKVNATENQNTVSIQTNTTTIDIDSTTKVSIDTISNVNSITTQVFTNEIFKKYKNIYSIDINHDGNQDLVITNVDKDGWDIWSALGKGDGKFEDPRESKIDNSKNDYNYSISFGDFNGDGITDIVETHSNDIGWFVKIAYGKSDGSFTNKNQGEMKISDLNFSYKNKFTVKAMLCASHFLEASLDKRTEELKKINNGEDVDASILNDKPKFIEYLVNRIYKFSYIPTPYFPSVAPGFFDGYTNQDCDKNGFKKISADDENIKRFGEGRNYDADGFATVNRYVYPLQSPYPKEDVSYANSVAFSIIDYWKPYVVDINGDGISDLVLSYPRQPEPNYTSGETNNLNGTWKTILVLNKAERSGLIDKVELGNGFDVKVNYSGSFENTEFDYTKKISYPAAPYLNSINVVNNVQTSDGIGGFNKTTYLFKNGMISLNGRGFISFQKIIANNSITGNQSIKEFLFDSSFIKWGIMPLESQKTILMSGVIINNETYSNSLFKNEDGDYTYNFINRKRTEKREINNKLIYDVSTDYEYDKFGNLIISDTHYPNGLKERITNQYFEGDNPEGPNEWRDKWLIGRLRQTTMRKEQNGGDAPVEKISSFQYDKNTGQLTQEKVLENSKYELIKEYIYDVRGNKIQEKTYPGPSAIETEKDPIVNKFTYDRTYDRFLTETEDAEGYTTNVVTDPVFGIDISKTDINGNITSFSLDQNAFDPFGSIKTTTLPDGNIAKEENFACNACKVKNAVYLNVKQSSINEFPLITFYDVLDRPISTINFDVQGRAIIKQNTYNQQGFIIKNTLPFFDGSTAVTEQMSYDDLGRLTKIIHADNTIEKIVYDSLSEKYINAKGQVKTKIKDVFGRVILETDNADNTIAYDYDLYGNQTLITDQKGRKFITLYNLLNQKEKFYNPNVGQWETYEYNAFGELVKVRTGEDGNVIIGYKYDRIGRMIDQVETVSTERGRSRVEDQISWTYITATSPEAGKGKIKSITNIKSSQDRKIDRSFKYDNFGRLTNKTFTNNLKSNEFTSVPFDFDDKFEYTYEYDNKGLISKVTYPKVRLNDYSRDFSVTYKYIGSTLVEVTSNTGVKIWELKDNYSDGKVKTIGLNNGKTISQYQYDDRNNHLKEISTTLNNKTIQDWRYELDDLGNIIRRSDDGYNKNLVETFVYDNLNRIKNSIVNADTVKYEYDAIGQIIYKSDLGYYKYNEKLHKLQINKDQSKNSIEDENLKKDDIEYYYDALGNRTKKEIEEKTQFEIEYNHFNKPDRITNFGDRRRDNYKDFYYGVDNSLEAEIDHVDKQYSCKYYIDGLFELEFNFDKSLSGAYTASQINQRFFISINGNIIAYNDVSSNNSKKDHLIFLHKDAIGTITAISDDKKVIQYFAYDIWGARRKLETWKLSKNISDSTFYTDKSFTGHQSWDDLGLINMGGRVFDPTIAQFLTPDPLLNLEISTQGLTGYSYCYNNPLIFIDPSGYFSIGGLFRSALRVLITPPALAPLLVFPSFSNFVDRNAGTIVAIELTVVFTATGVTAACPPAAGFATGFGSSFAQTYLNGGSFGQAVEAGFVSGTISGVTAGFTYAIGSAFTGSDALFGNNTVLNEAGKAAAHGALQGAMNEAQGGDFRSGFIGGAVSSLGDPLYQNIGGTSADAVIERTAIAATLGGTASALGGGKFMNGAASAAMVNLYNSELHNFMWGDYVYDNATGRLSRYNSETDLYDYVGTGYSGNSFGLNNSEYQGTGFIGPIPEGSYAVTPYTGSKYKQPAFVLSKTSTTDLLGRDNDFRIHGSNNYSTFSGSNGCPVFKPGIRKQIEPNTTFQVINSQPYCK